MSLGSRDHHASEFVLGHVQIFSLALTLLHRGLITSYGVTQRQTRMVRTFLKVYMDLGVPIFCFCKNK